MFLMMLRVVPWIARLRRSSSGRSTLMAFVFSSSVTLMLGCQFHSSLAPLGPSTLILPPSSFTFTPEGIATGCLPIRDMVLALYLSSSWQTPPVRAGVIRHAPALTGGVRLPNVGNHFAADFFLAGLAVAHDALVRADDRDSEAVEHSLQLVRALVDAQARLADAADVADHLLAFRAVLQVHA